MASEGDEENYPRLPDDKIVYRALRSSTWINLDTNCVEDVAYELRQSESGISVFICDDIPNEEDAQRITGLTKCHGVDSLTVGEIRELGLDVKQNKSDHAEIIGVPHKEDDMENALKLANKLAEISKKVSRRKKRD